MYTAEYAIDLGHSGLLERLLDKREIVDDCWVFTGCRTVKHYGLISACGKLRLAHRVSAAFWLGFDFNDSATCVLHRCDNPPCFNPDHLFFGTNLDNARDRHAKGRYATGFHTSYASLTEAQVEQVRARLASGESQASIGRRFGVHQTTIGKIARGVSYQRC